METNGSSSMECETSLEANHALLPQLETIVQPKSNNRLLGKCLLTTGAAMQGGCAEATTITEQLNVVNNRAKETSVLMGPPPTLLQPAIIPLAKATKQRRAAQEGHSLTCNFSDSIFGLGKRLQTRERSFSK
jgi:hypothetical protein